MSSAIWRLGSLDAWKLGGLEAWRLGGLEAWRLGGQEEQRVGGSEAKTKTKQIPKIRNWKIGRANTNIKQGLGVFFQYAPP